MKQISKKTIIIISVLFVLSEVFWLFQLIDILGEIGQYTYETTATIDFIGLPDGTIFVSCYDEDNVLHEDVKIRNRSIYGDFSRVESYYGTEIKIRLNPETDHAIWLSEYYGLWIIVIIIPLVYLILISLFWIIPKKNRN